MFRVPLLPFPCSGVLALLFPEDVASFSSTEVTEGVPSSSGTNWIGLRKLQELDVSDNCLSSLPTAVMHCLKSLSVLRVCRNRLSRVPDPWACPLVGTHTRTLTLTHRR